MRPGQCGRGDGAQGQKAHLSQRNEGRGLAYLERKRLCLQRPPGLRFPEFPPGAGTQPPPPAAEVILLHCAPGLHFPEFPGNPAAFLGRTCRLLHREPGLYFTACGSGANSAARACCQMYRTLLCTSVFSPANHAFRASFRSIMRLTL